MGFNKIAIMYFLGKGNIEAAESRFEMLKKIDPDHDDITFLWQRIALKRLGFGMERLKNKIEAKQKVTPIEQKIIETTEPPVFTHPEIEQLYENDIYDSPDTHVREEAKIGRNDPCPCGSGKKYKKCCLN